MWYFVFKPDLKNKMESSYLESELARVEQVMREFVDSFKEGISAQEQEMLTQYILRAENFIAEQRQACFDEFLVSIGELQEKRAQNPKRTLLYDRAEESLKRQFQVSLSVIVEMWKGAILSYQKRLQ